MNEDVDEVWFKIFKKNLKLHKNRAFKKTITLVNNIMLFFFKSRLTEI